MRTHPTGTPFLERPRNLACRMVMRGLKTGMTPRTIKPMRDQGALHGLAQTRLFNRPL